MKLKRVLVVHSIPGCPTLKVVRQTLDKYGINYTVIHRKFLNQRFFSNKDLVIVEGGDGTFLRTSHFVHDRTPMLGVNCDVKRNEGFFMTANRANFETRLRAIIVGRHKIRKLQRLEARLNNKVLPELAVNEVFVGDKNVHHTAHYWLEGEYQKSSGVIVAAPSGTHAWFKSAGGRQLPVTSKKFAYLVREPYLGRLSNAKHLQKVLNSRATVRIKSDIHEGILVVDGVSKEYEFCSGDRLLIRMSNKPLNVTIF
jgi:NAD+ kinase